MIAKTFGKRSDRPLMNWFRRFMYGRYGSDQFSIFLIVLYFVLILVGEGLQLGIISNLALVVVIYSIFRSMSRRLDRRRAENAKFMKLAGPAIGWAKMRHTIFRDRDHRYFKCPQCHQYLRVPKGKGKITINCRSCGVRFEEKS